MVPHGETTRFWRNSLLRRRLIRGAVIRPWTCRTEKEIAMNKDQAAGGWKELKGKIKQQWGKLTDDDLTVLEGSADELTGRIQKRYGVAKEEAEKQVNTFRDTNSDLVSRW